MASPRTGFGLPSRPDEGIRQRRYSRDAALPSNVPRPLPRSLKTQTEPPEARSQSISKAKIPGRKAQTFTPPQHPPPSQPLARPRLDRQSHSGGSTSTVGSKRSTSHSQGGSGSSSSSRSHESGLQPAHKLVRRNMPAISADVPGSRQAAPKAVSSSSLPRSTGYVEPAALGIQFGNATLGSPILDQFPDVPEMYSSTAPTPYVYPELDRYRDFERPVHSSDGHGIDVPFKLSTQDLPPPTPLSFLYSGSSQVSAASGSPSTRFSGSPGPGPYSRDTTPTSMSSQSPSIAASQRFNTKIRQNSPAQSRPPVTRRRAGSFSNEIDSVLVDPQGLAAVRESLTSSSSNSTVRDAGHAAKKDKRDNKGAKHLPPPPPSPPPRKSSQKLRKTKDEELSPPKVPQQTTQYARGSPSPPKSSGSSRLQPPSSPAIATAPRRPSRNGTPDLHSQALGSVPIIHSNLSTTSLPGERRGSESTEIPRGSSQSYLPTKNASTSHLPVGKEASSASKNLKINTEMPKPGPVEKNVKNLTPSPNLSSASSSRFPFFRRRKTAQDEESAASKKEKEKATRKGPAAGTGHEGYGRIGLRRRSGSISQLTRGAPGSAASQDSNATHDPFLADRLNPVVISGGNIIENRNASSELTRTESNQSVAITRPSLDSRFGSEASLPLNSGLRLPKSPPTTTGGSLIGTAARRPSDSSDSDGVTMKSTLAFRRSVHKLRSSPESPVHMPRPINTRGTTASPMTSFDTSVMSDDSFFDPQLDLSRGKTPDLHPAPKKLTKKNRSPRKWNFFGRSNKETEAKKNPEKVVATVIPVVEQKPVAFYAMMDASDQEEGEMLDIQEVLRNADVYMSPTMTTAQETSSLKNPTPELQPFATDNFPESLEPAPLNLSPAKTTAEPLPVLQVELESEQSLAPDRPSRLPQVGRIPKVISNRPGAASPMSFSRPFRSSVQIAIPTAEPYVNERIVQEAVLEKPSTPIAESTCDGSVAESGTNFSFMADSHPPPPAALSAAAKEFLAFSPRKDSGSNAGATSSTCSSGTSAAVGSTAVIPRPEDPPVEDEIWDEYDDLLDGNAKVRASTTSSQGVPFYLETYQSKLAKDKPMESPTIVPDSRKASVHSKAATLSSHYSADMTERIRAAFQPHPSPTASTAVLERKPVHKKQSQSLDSGKKVIIESRRSSASGARSRQSSCGSCSSEDDSPLAQVNLRVGSMTVSKWLTFGHVLFSDVRNELIPGEDSLKRQSILVIDGLGNDDWSFYAAETYPAATFYNLSPRAPLPAELQHSSSSFPLSPPNHHQIQFLSHQEKFPFAPQSFTCVVYRFPVAAPEAYYRNILAEARRVLKAGGYLELSILDVDLNNMGNRGRRTIRRLKERMHEQASDTSVASTADLIVRLLGKVGFTNIRAARVGVPVASPLTHSTNESIETARLTVEKKKDQRSLADMMNENGPVADESITKMVSRVGRWWYTRCYESAAGPSSQRSLWNDKALLSECEELGTSLKLMVCCARAPERINSV
ncbi:hypothetical protein S7711_07256 [Stachybotrys chartarum IBT 7711]|uniref:Methyltransferase type 11 domain-containing protein n=1 Tax=Stachybotrys chartarum (strain CBS 109288 / IBT 7711) TaxID=1280523 RepID=A0A084AS87_STACB|nr:hypothetical protein S7711_07256 [Stachybotrys chartarum IBT 7711]KFA52598.1 hypothetical protein S40293_07232 [Stachybotrys chartarum IBT 40293]